jgi:hypothetical protein
MPAKPPRLAVHFARLVVGLVFAMNVSCALAFLLRPGDYAAGFELDGPAGRIAVQGFGLLFLMWNATYPLVLVDPARHRAMFAVVLAQQALGVFGESWLLWTLPPGHHALWQTGLRFVIFDGLGLIGMGMAYLLLRPADIPAAPSAGA